MVSLQKLGIPGKQSPFLEVAKVASNARTARLQRSLFSFGNRHELNRGILAALLHYIGMNLEELGRHDEKERSQGRSRRPTFTQVQNIVWMVTVSR
jgi:hypothetical protein